MKEENDHKNVKISRLIVISHLKTRKIKRPRKNQGTGKTNEKSTDPQEKNVVCRLLVG